MQVEILGSAAGGGFPQWNCGCANCNSAREGTSGFKARSQTQIVVRSESSSCFLLNASPDLRAQIHSCPWLIPNPSSRLSALGGVVLTGSDVDQVAGLLSLRELHRFSVFATPSVRRILQEDNSLFGMLNRIPSQVKWVDIEAASEFYLLDIHGQSAEIRCQTFPVAKSFPAYVRPERSIDLAADEASLGLILVSEIGSRLAFFPTVAAVDEALKRRLDGVDILLFDGTFWSEDELQQVDGRAPTAATMGHIPISGPLGSLAQLADARCGRKIFIHMNNTNPILDSSSTQYAMVRAAGWEIAEDGWQFNL